ncbi:MAG: tRNA threonylcarbamoyladenosine dehydratase [Tannerella sp.]|nr:tRNA threonylcarbamoyladenosine dehydratase [Tannerella sp.]
MEEYKSIFSRTTLLIGQEAQNRIADTRVILFGVGGVGSWCAESLVRSGIRYLTIVDADTVNITNINRQLPATTRTIDKPKVEVLKQRLEEINPAAQINFIQMFYDAETAGLFQLDSYNYIIDAIDSLESKAHLIYTATQTDAVFLSSMGAALKMNAARIQVAEFWKVHGCPLAAALRRKLKQRAQYPGKKFQCVFSDELLENKGTIDSLTLKMNDQVTKRVNGTLAHITAIFGFTLAGLVIQDICS